MLLVERGMHGATGNIYVGLHEFEEMAFTAHFLRAGDQMVDVGANIGSYSVLAAGVAGADVLACEPIPSTFAWLEANVAANGLQGRVRLLQVAIGAERGLLRMSRTAGAANRVLPQEERNAGSMDVEATTLDDVLGVQSAALIKIDIEGHEAALVRGAGNALARASAVLIESADHDVWRALMNRGSPPAPTIHGRVP